MSARKSPCDVSRIAIVGTGVIGAGWAAFFLAKGLSVCITDPCVEALDRVEAFVHDAWPAMVAAGVAPSKRNHQLYVCSNLENACRDADYVQECGPENVQIKSDVIAQISRYVGEGVVIASSSSSLLPSSYQSDAIQPARVVAAHPFNPPFLIPLVEVAGGTLTDPDVIQWTIDFFEFLGKKPVRVLHEVPGYIANRMSAALFREAVDLVATGTATVEDVDRAVRYGPGLRWAVMGPHLGYHLAGGSGGYRHYLQHLGPAQEARWADLGSTPLSADVIEQLVAGLTNAIRGASMSELTAARDASLADLLHRMTEIR